MNEESAQTDAVAEAVEAEASAPAVEEKEAAWLRDALLAGIQRVLSQRDYINQINVFPVADGDTGTNLAFTLHAVMHAIRGDLGPDVGELARRAADVALDSSRGNSGAIFAQYLQGFSEGVDDAQTLTFPRYAVGADVGATSARGAIAEPREGTMLSVIRAYADALLAEPPETSLASGLAIGLAAAREALARTPEQLEVLRQHDVVDAGGQGFVDVLEGMQAFVESGTVEGLVPEELELPDDAIAPAIEANESDHRFCTECMLTGDAIDRMKLREAIQEFGASSLVIAGTKRKVRVHVHVDNPGALFLLCEDFGVVSSQKADDMERQRSAHGVRQRVAIVTDTGADIPDAELERLQIHLVPLRVHFGDRQHLDKVSLTPGEFYERLENGDRIPRTSQPPPGDFRRQFDFLGSHYDGVVCVTISAALSGTWQAAENVARRSRFDHLSAIDSMNASAGQGLLTMYAAEAALAGATRQQIVDLLAEERGRLETFAILPDLAYPVRGGRLPGWVERVANFLRLMPVIGTDGKGRIKPRGVIFGRDDRPRRFARWMAKRAPHGDGVRVMIAHCNNNEGARALRDQLVRLVPRVHSVYLTEAGTALGAHAGPGTLIVSIQRYVPPEDRLANGNATGETRC
ncbi:MAG: DegV family protein [Pseudomonadota bacterium]